MLLLWAEARKSCAAMLLYSKKFHSPRLVVVHFDFSVTEDANAWFIVPENRPLRCCWTHAKYFTATMCGWLLSSERNAAEGWAHLFTFKWSVNFLAAFYVFSYRRESFFYFLGLEVQVAMHFRFFSSPLKENWHRCSLVLIGQVMSANFKVLSEARILKNSK